MESEKPDDMVTITITAPLSQLMAFRDAELDMELNSLVLDGSQARDLLEAAPDVVTAICNVMPMPTECLHCGTKIEPDDRGYCIDCTINE